MGFKDRILRFIVKNMTFDELYQHLFPSKSGPVVSNDSAQRLFAVYACVNVLAETLASLPLKIYKNNNGSRDLETGSYLNSVLKHPNDRDNQFDFLEEMMTHLVLRGRFFAIKITVGTRLVKLLPIDNPDLVNVDDTDYELTFTYKGQAFTKKDMFCVFAHNGRSFISQQRDLFGKAMALNDYTSAYFRNGAVPMMAITNEKKVDLKDMQALKDQWNDIYSGASNAHKVAVLDNGKKIEKLSLSNEDSQFLETQKYTDTQICGIFRVPPHMIGLLENATFSNIEHQGLEFSKNTMSPWCKRVEMALNDQIIKPNLGQNHYCEFNMDYIERGSLYDRYQGYAKGREAGFLSVNEIRQKENLDRLPPEVGDKYLIPSNMTIAGEKHEEQVVQPEGE